MKTAIVKSSAVLLPSRYVDYVQPSECGKNSEARAVGRRIGRMLDALGTVNRWVAEGAIVKECDDFSWEVREKLRASGWRVTVGRGDKWQVLPPKGGQS